MKAVICAWMLLCYYAGLSQSLPAQVVGASGDNYMTVEGSLEWTLGEIMIETYSSSFGFLTQGFQQPSKVIVTGIVEKADSGITVFPNPVENVLYLQTTRSGDYHIQLMNLQGQQLIHETIHHSASAVHEIDMHDYGMAIYLLNVIEISTGSRTYIKIEKL